ncbi:MAG: ZIP family metal transporter [Gammaproteobacteria bacterium]|nr:ZIP family metal transporter [Gammaproteobacteria bacterium]
MELLLWILIFSLLGGVLSVLVASVFLLIPQHIREQILPHSVSFAIGALLGAAFLALLPHAISSPQVTDVHLLTTTVLIGLMLFFVLEKMVLWRHCHSHECEAHTLDEHHDHKGVSSSLMILVGDGLHNFVDGVLIAAAFMTDFHLGVVTALAVAAHEIPQEVGDFIVLLKGGLSRGKALLFNILSSLTTLLGAVLAYFSFSSLEVALPYVLAIAASSFIYIAVADLIPGLHTRTRLRDGMTQIVLIVSGIAVIYLAHSTLH